MKSTEVFLCLSAALFVAACGSSENSETKALIAAKARRWADRQSIPICFVNRDDVKNSLYDDILRSAVSQFARAGIGFQKWRECESTDYDRDIIRVKLKTVYDWDADRYTAGGGKSRVGVSRTGLSGEDGATLWIKVGRDGEYPTQASAGKKNWIANYTRGTFIHEIGHALGLMHEHQRTDFHPKGGECGSALEQPNINESGEYEYVGSADYESIMSYCSQGTGQLSDGDIAGIRALYPD